jgi:GT2 family glycosyltransferase
MAELSVLIVNYNTWRECAAAIASLRRHGPTHVDGSPMPFECIVVDNRSPRRPEPEIAAVQHELRLLADQQGDEQAGRLVLHDENGGYSKGMNLALAHSRGRWILVSNPDVVFTAGLVDALHRALLRDPRAGCVVPKGFWDPGCTGHLPPNTLPTLWDVAVGTLGEFLPSVSRWYARRLARSWVRVWSAEQPLALPMMSGCMFLIDRAYFESVGRFDERYPLYYEDTDLSLTIRRSGRHVVQVPGAHLVHLVNRSGMSDPTITTTRHDQSRVLYYRKWYGRLGPWWLRVCRWALTTPRLAWLRRKPASFGIEDLGAGAERPVLRLPRSCERFLLLMSLDSRFYLSGGTFGSGDRWSPNDAMWSNFASTTFYFTVYDLTGGRFESLGKWCWRNLSHLGVPPVPPAAPNPQQVAGGKS